MNIQTLFDVREKTVVVTGGGKGLGKMISRAFVANGARVYIASRDRAACEETAKELSAEGPGCCVSLAADLASLEGVNQLVTEFARHEKHLNVLVNNSGATHKEALETYPDEAFLPYLLAAVPADAPSAGPWEDPARIINIGSVAALWTPVSENYAYSASKAGLHQLNRVFAGTLGRKGITSNTVACGAFETDMMAPAIATPGAMETVLNGIPLRRIGQPPDIAGVCLFLASQAGAFVNGATISMDGGAVVSNVR